MATDVKLPRLGQGMESGTIVKWLKAEGDRVEKGEPLYELDTDKATQEVEAEASGVLLKIAVPSGEVPVGQTVATIGEAGESAPEPAEEESPGRPAASAGADAEPEPQPAGETPQPAEVAASGDGSGEPGATRLKASPLARRIARERGIELASVTGTGPDGRIVAEDVERAQAAGPAAPAAPAGCCRASPRSIPLTSIRKTIARRLGAAWEVPVFQLTVSVDMTNAGALVERSRELDPEVRVTVTDLIAKVCARALMRHRDVNVSYTDEALLRFPSANIGIAVAAPQGLVVPVIRSVERLSLAEIAAARADVVERARAAKLQAGDLELGTFTISNLGMYGVEQFVAVLNPPQAAILAVGAIVEQPVVRGGEVVVRPAPDRNADRRPPCRRRRPGGRLPGHDQALARRSSARPVIPRSRPERG